MGDARCFGVGLEADIETRIAELTKKGSDDAKLATLVWDAAQNRPLDLAALIVPAGDNTQGLAPVLGEGREVIPLDIEVIQQALAQPTFRAAGQALLDERIETAVERHQDVVLTWLRKLKRQNDTTVVQNQVTGRDLKHWVVSDEITQGNLSLGHVTSSVWLRRDGSEWGHEFGPDMSYLFLRYPLQGDVTIALRSKDGAYQEGGATFGGMMVDFLCRHNCLGFGESAVEMRFTLSPVI